MTGGMTQPLVYFFGQGRADGTAAMKDLLGGKGAPLLYLHGARGLAAQFHHFDPVAADGHIVRQRERGAE